GRPGNTTAERRTNACERPGQSPPSWIPFALTIWSQSRCALSRTPKPSLDCTPAHGNLPGSAYTYVRASIVAGTDPSPHPHPKPPSWLPNPIVLEFVSTMAERATQPVITARVIFASTRTHGRSHLESSRKRRRVTALGSAISSRTAWPNPGRSWNV